MSDIAGAAGVSRQTLYKEFGSRDEFGQAFVIHEGERFLDEVDAAVRQHLDDPRAAVGAALETLPAHRRRGPARPHPAQRRRHRRHAALRHHPGDAGRRLGDRPALRRRSSEGWPQAPPDKVAAARRVPGPARDQLHHRARATRPRRPPPQAGELLGPFIDRALGVAGLRRADDDLRPHRRRLRRGAPRRPADRGRVEAALGDARTVLNVGAGTGSYEPADREVTAVEPSAVMIAQRAAGRGAGRPGERRGAALRGRQLRRGDGDDHRPPLGATSRPGWPRWRRVARDRVVVLSFDPAPLADFWLVGLLPARVRDPRRVHAADRASSRRCWAAPAVETVPIPRRCTRRLLLRALGPPRDAPRPRGAPRQHGLARDGAGGDRARPRGAAAPTSRAAAGTSATATCARTRRSSTSGCGCSSPSSAEPRLPSRRLEEHVEARAARAGRARSPACASHSSSSGFRAHRPEVAWCAAAASDAGAGWRRARRWRRPGGRPASAPGRSRRRPPAGPGSSECPSRRGRGRRSASSSGRSSAFASTNSIPLEPALRGPLARPAQHRRREVGGDVADARGPARGRAAPARRRRGSRRSCRPSATSPTAAMLS